MVIWYSFATVGYYIKKYGTYNVILQEEKSILGICGVKSNYRIDCAPDLEDYNVTPVSFTVRTRKSGREGTLGCVLH